MSPLALCIQVGAVLVAYRVLRFFKVLNAYGYNKGYRPLLDPHSLPGNVIPANWWHPGFMWPWIQRKHAHFNHTHDLTTLVPLLLGNGAYFAASVDVAKQVWVNEAKTHLVKPADFTTENVWGSSIASANGEDWKRHRRVVAPAFTSKMHVLINFPIPCPYIQPSTGELLSGGPVLTNLHSLLLRFTLVMICRCGFGMPVNWEQSTDQDEVAIFDRALFVASTTLVHRLIFPKWVWKLPLKRLRDIDESWKTLIALLNALAAIRQAQYSAEEELGEEHAADLFTKLISATNGATKYELEPPQVTANMLSLLFAGNETTSSALMSTVVFLGLHPDEQQKAYKEIIREVQFEQNMVQSLRDIGNLKHVLACMHEAHRLVPATINLARDVPEDIIIHSVRPVEKDVVVAKGSRIVVDVMAVCHNPHDFPDPEEFKPERWQDVPDHDVIMFGAGPRSCVGRRFAQTEAVCFLAHFLRDWEVETVMQDGETKEGCLERIMAGASMFGTAFRLGEVPVKLIAR
ncbi:cytochrome P450, partial [Mycena latifolia]